jgi:hypothetical protein
MQKRREKMLKQRNKVAAYAFKCFADTKVYVREEIAYYYVRYDHFLVQKFSIYTYNVENVQFSSQFE